MYMFNEQSNIREKENKDSFQVRPVLPTGGVRLGNITPLINIVKNQGSCLSSYGNNGILMEEVRLKQKRSPNALAAVYDFGLIGESV